MRDPKKTNGDPRIRQAQNPPYDEDMIALNVENMKGVGILDGGATKSVGSHVLSEELIEEWHDFEEAPPTELEET